MIRSLTEVQKAATFYLITLGLAVLVALFGPAGADSIQTLNMLTATAGVLLMLLVITPDGYHRAGWAQLALHRAGFRYWPLALLGPAAVLAVSYGAATLLGVVSLQFESDAAINLAINIVIISFFAFFEEIGWRGYMLPNLATRYPRLAPALVGFLHGVWHLPLMLLTTAYNPAGNRLIVVPLFLAVLTVAGILYGYLRNESGSLWPVVIAHGTFNAVLGVLAGAAVTNNPTTAAYLTGETGVFTLLALVLLTWILMRRSAMQKEDHLVAQR
ncbi:MAG TPA: CPBP family intramembrane glutamic endopeptidase [Propionibacteriaceae bacterium]|nr:CPBP family intramembrane glutamic endopeptidase [Propionibacteriaceae bacterium]